MNSLRKIMHQPAKDIRMSVKIMKLGALALLVGGVTATTAAYGQWFGGKDTKSVPMQEVADMLHAVMESDRTVYTQMVVQRLQNQEKVIRADEHFKDKKALPLPAQMFRFGAEKVGEKTKTHARSGFWVKHRTDLEAPQQEKTDLEAPQQILRLLSRKRQILMLLSRKRQILRFLSRKRQILRLLSRKRQILRLLSRS